MSRTINYILLDIEGTTTSISFVKDELFPYVRKNLYSHFENRWDSEELQNDIESLRAQLKEDVKNGMDNAPHIADASSSKDSIITSVFQNVIWQMDIDRKATALKQLQGHMWREGYEAGTILGHVYEDVEDALKSWTSNGKKVYIYSSGSIEAQKLIFGHSVAGNLTKYLSGYFDTTIGLKILPSSYQEIIKELKATPEEILFFTDIAAEGIAAREAGIQVNLMVRPGNAPLNPDILSLFPTCSSFLNVAGLN